MPFATSFLLGSGSPLIAVPSSDYVDLAAGLRLYRTMRRADLPTYFPFPADDGGNAQSAVVLVRSAPTGFFSQSCSNFHSGGLGRSKNPSIQLLRPPAW